MSLVTDLFTIFHKLWKKLTIKKSYQFEQDWQFAEVNVGEIEEEWITAIKILAGPYTGVVYYYNSVKFEERGDKLHVLFSFRIHNQALIETLELSTDPEFFQVIGDILVQLLEDNTNVEAVTAKEHFSESEPDVQIRTDDPQEPHL